MRVTFILPAYARLPLGGFKVVYEYANWLSRRGHEIAVVHPHNLVPANSPLQAMRSRLWMVKRRLRDRGRIPWFAIDDPVRLLFAPDLRERFLPEADAIVATAWETAPWVARAAEDRGRKFHLVQGNETWTGPQEEVAAVWTLPLRKIVIAKWLEELGRQHGLADSVTYIPNGIDHEEFYITTPPADRAPRVAMLYHPAESKGAREGLQALQVVKAEIPQLEATFFGTWPRPEGLPSWIDYIESPHGAAVRDIYNAAAIFLHPSWSEGWALPPAEAMACGCALVAAENAGFLDYAIPGTTALTAPVRNADMLAVHLATLLKDDALRIRLAEAGEREMRAYTWTRAVDAMERVLTSAVESGA